MKGVEHLLRKNKKPPFRWMAELPETPEDGMAESRFVEFRGAAADVDEMTGKLDYTERGKVTVNLDNVGGYYDHTILLMGHKIRVMETYDEIRKEVAKHE